MEIIESIINISEGRDNETVKYIADSVKNTSGCFLLDSSSDPDHNRSVISFVGNRKSLPIAVQEFFKRALEKIDLRKHHGEHPRIGAVDVVPFVPIREVTMQEVVAFSKEIGEMLAKTFNLPIFLYEESQKIAERKNLALIRKGEFENLPEKMKDPVWRPDFGPSLPHPSAGATVVGARMPLIAFNVNLGTKDVNIANAIAKAIRGSSGGLAAVKALGIVLQNREIVQVSMNLVDYKKSPIFRVFEMIRSEAKRYGVPIVGSEIIGLIPQEALCEAAEFYLKIENFAPSLILENKINDVIRFS
ncbi:glutamate formimidoyltransferase [bacterium]|nr:glutamate formimidoyltransferase [bacterium]